MFKQSPAKRRRTTLTGRGKNMVTTAVDLKNCLAEGLLY